MPSFTILRVLDLLLEEVIEHARATLPDECCGLLAGHIVDGVGVVAARFHIENAAASPTEYITDPRGLLSAFRLMREHGWELLAVYHSHPTSEPVPSRRDIERNTYDETAVHLIVGNVTTQPDVRAWWLAENDYRPAVLKVKGPFNPESP